MELQLAHFSVQKYLQSKQIEATFPGKAAGVYLWVRRGQDSSSRPSKIIFIDTSL